MWLTNLASGGEGGREDGEWGWEGGGKWGRGYGVGAGVHEQENASWGRWNGGGGRGKAEGGGGLKGGSGEEGVGVTALHVARSRPHGNGKNQANNSQECQE